MRVNKITNYIVLGITTLLVGALLPISNAISLYKKFASSITLDFSTEVEEEIVETNYYLVGSFNDWTTSNTYKLTLNEAATLDENQTAEYMIQDIPLDKGVTLKIRDDASPTIHYCNTYTHQWSNSVSYDESGNYIVPMTSNSYSFYLKVYNDGSLSAHVTANKDVLFYKYTDSRWDKNGTTGKLFAHFWKNNPTTDLGDPQFTNLNNGYYKVNVPTGSGYVIVAMLNSDASSFAWNQVVKQSGDIELANYDTNNCVTNPDWDITWTASNGSSWSAM